MSNRILKSRVLQRRARKKQDPSKGYTILACIMISILCMVGVFYIVQVNGVAIKGSQIGEYQRQIEELRTFEKKLEIEVARLKSLPNLQERVKALDMVEVEERGYLMEEDTSVAAR